MKTTLNKQFTMANLQKNMTITKSRDFLTACKLIEAQSFNDYDNENYDWLGLFFDENNGYWCVEYDYNAYEWVLTIDGDKVVSLGEHDKFIKNFITKKEREKIEEQREEREYHEQREELFRHYNYGLI